MTVKLATRGNCTFKRRDVTAAIRAVSKAGCEISRVEISPDGRIIVVTGKASDSVSAVDGGNPWDTI